MNKQDAINQVITDDSSCREYVADYMADQQAFDFKLMLRELKNEDIDHAKIGRIFQRAFERTINDYASNQW